MVAHRTKIWGAWQLLAWLHAKIAAAMVAERRTSLKCWEMSLWAMFLCPSVNVMRKTASTCGWKRDHYKIRRALRVSGGTRRALMGSYRLLPFRCFRFILLVFGKTSQARQREHTVWFAQGMNFFSVYLHFKTPSFTPQNCGKCTAKAGAWPPLKPERRRFVVKVHLTCKHAAKLSIRQPSVSPHLPV